MTACSLVANPSTVLAGAVNNTESRILVPSLAWLSRLNSRLANWMTGGGGRRDCRVATMIRHGGRVNDPDVIYGGRIRDCSFDVEQISTARRLFNELMETVADQHVVQLSTDASVDAGTVEITIDDQPGRAFNDSVRK